MYISILYCFRYIEILDETTIFPTRRICGARAGGDPVRISTIIGLDWFVRDRRQTNDTRDMLTYCTCNPRKTRMWANAQRDGRPAEYRWRPLFNAAKFGWRPLLECLAVTLPRRETRWNLQGCLKLQDRSQPLVGRSSPYYGDMWRRYCCLSSYFRLSIYASVTKI